MCTALCLPTFGNHCVCVCPCMWLQVWPGPTHYPDFLSVNKTWPWWRDQLKRLWDTVRQAVMTSVAFTHCLIHSLCHSLTASSTHCIIHSLPHSLTACFTYCIIYSLPHLPIVLSTHCLSHSLPQSRVVSFTHRITQVLQAQHAPTAAHQRTVCDVSPLLA